MQQVEKTRCKWVTNDPLYIQYHDEEWGKPCFDRLQLFTMLCLEGQQAGLSWITVLKKRAHYLECFENFVPEIVANYDELKLLSLLEDKGLIRNRLKLKSIIRNANALLKMEEAGEDFVSFIWSFVNGVPQVNYIVSQEYIPVKTAEAEAMSKALKKRGFNFVGPTICYSFMQACGLVNDHLVSCISFDASK